MNPRQKHFLVSAFLAVTIIVACLGTYPTTTAAAPSFAGNPSAISAPNAILLDEASGRVLWSKSINQVVRPASLTKLMTLNLIFEAVDSGKVNLTDLVPVSAKAAKTEGSEMGLKAGDQVPLEDIIKGIVIASGNDACVAAAEFISGSVDEFVTLMNTRAQQMELASTKFVDPHGISDSNQTTACDMAFLARAYAKDHPSALAYHSMTSYTYTPASGKAITQKNRNNLLGVYEGLDGLKTGHTSKAGYCLVATAGRSGTRFIAVVLGIKASSDSVGEKLRAQDMTKLLDYGFDTYETRAIVSQGEQLDEIKVYKGKANTVKVGAAWNFSYTVEKGAEFSVTKNLTLEPKLMAPVKAGQSVGNAQILLNGEVIQTVPVVTIEAVPEGNFFKKALDSIKLMFNRSPKGE